MKRRVMPIETFIRQHVEYRCYNKYTVIGVIEITLLVICTAVAVAHSHDQEYEHGKQDKADQDACHAVWKRKG